MRSGKNKCCWRRMASQETTSNRGPSTRPGRRCQRQSWWSSVAAAARDGRDADVLAFCHASLDAAMHTQSTVHIHRVPIKQAIIYTLTTWTN